MSSSSIRVLDIKRETRCEQSTHTTQDDWHTGPLSIYIEETDILNLYESEDQENQPSFRLSLLHTRHLGCAQPPNASKKNMCAQSIDTIPPFRSTAQNSVFFPPILLHFTKRTQTKEGGDGRRRERKRSAWTACPTH